MKKGLSGQILVDALCRRFGLWEQLAQTPGLDPRKRQKSGHNPEGLHEFSAPADRLMGNPLPLMIYLLGTIPLPRFWLITPYVSQ